MTQIELRSEENHRFIGTDDRRDRVWNRLLFVTMLTWTFLAMCFPLLDTDFWWHLKTGEWILAGNGIPFVDLYTFTNADRAWIDLHWGFQVLIAVLFRIGGAPLVTLAKAGTITASVAIAWQAGGVRLPAWKKSVVWLLPIVCIVGRGFERPEMLSLLFLAVWLWIARHTDQRPNWIWALPLVQLVWVNCHVLFVLGLVVGFCYAVDAIARVCQSGRFGLEPRTEGPSIPLTLIVGALAVLVCFANPYFEEGFLFPLTVYRKFSAEKDFYSKNIGEFQPPLEFVMRHGIGNIYLLAELGVWLLTAGSFVWLLVNKRRWSPFRLLLFAGFTHLAWQASRNTNIFALVSGFIACENFRDSSQASAGSLASKPTNALIHRTKAMVALMVVLCLSVVTGWWNELGEKNKPFRLGEAPHWFIHDAAIFAGQPGFPGRAFVSHIGQAEVYIYHNGPYKKVAMDARLEVCTQQSFERFNDAYAAMSEGHPRWMNLFRDGDLPVVILDSRYSRSAINGMMGTRGWRMVFADRAAAVFLPSGLADRLHLPTVDPTPLMFPDGVTVHGQYRGTDPILQVKHSLEGFSWLVAQVNSPQKCVSPRPVNAYPDGPPKQTPD